MHKQTTGKWSSSTAKKKNKKPARQKWILIKIRNQRTKYRQLPTNALDVHSACYSIDEFSTEEKKNVCCHLFSSVKSNIHSLIYNRVKGAKNSFFFFYYRFCVFLLFLCSHSQSTHTIVQNLCTFESTFEFRKKNGKYLNKPIFIRYAKFIAHVIMSVVQSE